MVLMAPGRAGSKDCPHLQTYIFYRILRKKSSIIFAFSKFLKISITAVILSGAQRSRRIRFCLRCFWQRAACGGKGTDCHGPNGPRNEHPLRYIIFLLIPWG